VRNKLGAVIDRAKRAASPYHPLHATAAETECAEVDLAFDRNRAQSSGSTEGNARETAVVTLFRPSTKPPCMRLFIAVFCARGIQIQ
jgi:hypothetical protein